MLCSGVVRRCKSEDGGMNCRGDSEVTRPESGNGETRDVGKVKERLGAGRRERHHCLMIARK